MTAKIAAGCLKRTPPTMAEERRAFNSCLKEAQKLVKNVFVQLSGGAFCAARTFIFIYRRADYARRLWRLCCIVILQTPFS